MYLPTSHAALENALLSASGMTFIGIDTSTTPRLVGGAGNLHIDRVRKIMRGATVMVFQNKRIHGYEAMVKRRLVAEGKDPASFRLSPRAWGRRIPGTPFVEHKGRYYLEVIFLNTGDIHYTLDGVAVPTNLINGLTLTPSNGHQGGLENKVVLRTFALESITRVTVNHQTFRF